MSDQHANKGASLGEKLTSRAVKRTTLRRGRDCPTAPWEGGGRGPDERDVQQAPGLATLPRLVSATQGK